MAEHFDHIPRNPQKWTEKAPLLGKWLWVLFWLAIPQALASLLMSSLFSSQSLPYLLGQIMQVVYLLGCGLALLKLSSAMDLKIVLLSAAGCYAALSLVLWRRWRRAGAAP